MIHSIFFPAKRPQSGQRGVVLITTLILLIIVSIVTFSAMRFTALNLQLSNNHQAQVDAFEWTQSMIDAALSDPANTLVTGGAGYTNCTAGLSGCDANTVTLPDNLLASEISNGHAEIAITRQEPDLKPMPRGLGYSVECFKAAAFDVRASYDMTAQNLGRDEIHRGVIVAIGTGSC